MTRILSIHRAVQIRLPHHNDDFEDAQPMRRLQSGTGFEQLLPVPLAGATIQHEAFGGPRTDPVGSNWVGSDGFQSLWWRYDPAGSRHVAVRNTLSTHFDGFSVFPDYSGGPTPTSRLNVMMAAYGGGPALADLSELDSTDSDDPTDDPTSGHPAFDPRLDFDVVGGETYWVQVCSWKAGMNGEVVLEWNLT